ncbi:hypothetical protein HK096_008545, partial [Nowakowskiella sp. JEL0078]
MLFCCVGVGLALASQLKCIPFPIVAIPGTLYALIQNIVFLVRSRAPFKYLVCISGTEEKRQKANCQ